MTAPISQASATLADISLLDYVGLAVLYAGIGTILLGGLGRAARRPSTMRLLPTAFSVLFFVALTQHPLPDSQVLAQVCPMPRAEPNLVPFAFVAYVIGRWRSYGTVQTFVLEWSAVVFAMNFLLCGVVGLVASRHRLRARSAVALGFAMSLFVEVTQLTAAWGSYPCAWRKFDVDDLILNTAGVAAGSLVGSRLQKRRQFQAVQPLPGPTATTSPEEPGPAA